MSRDNLVRIGAVLAVLMALLWLAYMTEWTEIQTFTPARNEAATNGYYAAQAVLRKLGAKVVERQSLEQLPPPQARLVLVSQDWALLPNRAKNLWRWVEQGGQLVLSGSMLYQAAIEAKSPITESDTPYAPPRAAPASRPKPVPAAPPKPVENCRLLTEPPGAQPAFAQGEPLRICSTLSYTLTSELPVTWRINNATLGAEAMRVRYGQGSVTAIAPRNVFDNHQVLRGDHALLLAAALQLHAGDEVWFVTQESRPALLVWLWQSAWVALLLGLLALAAALWRHGMRFGPLAAAPTLVRRSMREQVSGTAQFLRQHGVAALHQAQLRALNQVAQRHLRQYAGLDAQARAQAIANATGLGVAAMAGAMQPGLARDAPGWTHAMQLMEVARRRLQTGALHPSL